MTRYAKSLGAFADVKQVFDAALAHGNVNYEMGSYAKAIAWRTRAYKYRNMLLENSAKALEATPGIAPSTPYDTIFISVLKGETKVVVHRQRPTGKLTTADGRPIELERLHLTIHAQVDPLQEEADRIAREADIEI